LVLPQERLRREETKPERVIIALSSNFHNSLGMMREISFQVTDNIGVAAKG